MKAFLCTLCSVLVVAVSFGSLTLIPSLPPSPSPPDPLPLPLPPSPSPSHSPSPNKVSLGSLLLFTGANLTHADLSGSMLRAIAGGDFTIDFTEANLANADMSGMRSELTADAITDLPRSSPPPSPPLTSLSPPLPRSPYKHPGSPTKPSLSPPNSQSPSGMTATLEPVCSGRAHTLAVDKAMVVNFNSITNWDAGPASAAQSG